MTEAAVVSPGSAGEALRRRLDLRRRLPSPSTRRSLRVGAGISAAELAEDLGVSRQAVAQWERGDRTPRGPYLETYVEALEALADEIGRAT